MNCMKTIVLCILFLSTVFSVYAQDPQVEKLNLRIDSLKYIIKDQNKQILEIKQRMNIRSAQPPVRKTDSGVNSPEINTSMRWNVGIGINAIDDNGRRLSSLSGLMIMPIPSIVQGGYYLAFGLSAEALLSFNQYQDGKLVNGSETSDVSSNNNLYYSLDALLKYDLKKIWYRMHKNMQEPTDEEKKAQKFDPYVLYGYGLVHNAYFEKNSTLFTNDIGLGFNIWIKPFLGLNFQSIGKWRMTSGESNTVQFSIGFVYRFPYK